jgi:hypothetical protein
LIVLGCLEFEFWWCFDESLDDCCVSIYSPEYSFGCEFVRFWWAELLEKRVHIRWKQVGGRSEAGYSENFPISKKNKSDFSLIL